MQTSILAADKDPMGAAIADYFETGKAGTLRVFSSQFDEDEIPVRELFRTYGRMPALEQKALQLAAGNILDVGAGSGCHSLALQQMDKTVTAIDISLRSVEVMQKRGVRSAQAVNLFDPSLTGRFDTVLMLMNGSGIIGRLDNMPLFFRRMRELLTDNGCVLMDSSDLSYLLEDENGEVLIDLAADYYGQVDFCMQYRDVRGDSFDWLYVDFDTLSLYAERNGFCAELVAEGKHYDYLARLTPVKPE